MNPHVVNGDPLTMYDYSTYNYNHHLPPQPIYPYNDSILKAQQQYLNPYTPLETAIPEQTRKIPEFSNTSYTDISNSNPNLEPPPPSKPLESDKEKPTEIIKNLFMVQKPESSPKKRRPRKKIKKERSNYWSEKITESGYPFYECSMCSVFYSDLHDLDSHVTVHEGRLTSYDLKLRNKLKKKLQLKQKRKAKKEKEEKKLKPELEFEIKPEGGYVGDENATDYFNKNDANGTVSSAGNVNSVQNVSSLCDQIIGNVNEQNVNNGGVTDQKANSDSVDGEENEKKKKNKLEEMVSNDNLMKIYKCHACQKQFALSYYLKLHVRSHTDEKPYPCNQCPQSFITASKRNRHVQRIHHAVKYQCRICFKLYSKFEQLTKHFDKKHPEDKLEGEPYDFNEILPYLKDLEAELISHKTLTEEMKPETNEKTEPVTEVPKLETDSKTHSKPDDKPDMDKADIPKTFIEISNIEPKLESAWPEESWIDDDYGNDDICSDNLYMNDDQPKCYAQEFVPPTRAPETVFEKVTCDGNSEVNNETNGEVNSEVKLEGGELDVKVKVEIDETENKVKECESDDEYFPSNTWLPEPKEEPQPEKKKKRRGRKTKYPSKCEICEKTINSASYMVVHLRTHSGERPFKCYICERGFITSNKMHRHVLTHPEAQENLKEEADIKEEEEEYDGRKSKKRKRNSANQLLSAKKKMKAREHVCEFCQKRFKHLHTLNVHRKSHDGQEIILKCNFCLEVVADEEAQRKHEATHTGPKPFLCTICGRNYLKKLSMMTHRKTHTASDSKRFVCEVCSKTFNAECKLQKHMVGHRVDKFVLRYECPVCAHMFNTKYHVQMHLQTHQKEGLILEENKNEILAMVLQNARKIPSKKDATTPALTEIIPNDERSRVCNICGEVFQHFYYLEEHLKSHGSKIALSNEEEHEEKKHICPVCNKGFKLHYYLKLHSFTHTKEKPFSCHQCGKGFITKGKLKRHLETHSGLKKYQCHVCYKFFTRPSYLRIHIRTIHGTQDYNFRLNKQFMDNVSVDNVSMMS